MTHTQPAADRQQDLRRLPAVDALLRAPAVAALTAAHGNDAVVAAVRDALAAARAAILAGEPAPPAAAWPALVAARLEEDAAPSLFAVVNATGVIIHTNLGRARQSAARWPQCSAWPPATARWSTTWRRRARQPPRPRPAPAL
jgi:hypothetical protein